ncbi:MAG: PPC domain-containing protein [Gemmatimonadota bacterium]|nr:PPC domain-containing protein [Gemmatimonadota bacterium]
MNRLALLSILAVAAAAPAAAQRPIRVGQETLGSLVETDPRLQDGTYYNLWSFQGRRGDQVRITMASGAFDTYLTLARVSGGRLEELSSDDDGGGGTNSRVVATLPGDGTYVLRANSMGRATGSYTLLVHSNGEAGGDGDLEMHHSTPVTEYRSTSISAGRAVSGSLDSSDPVLNDRTYYDLYTYRGRRGERLRITLRSSDFDAYLELGTRRGGGYSRLASNDDGGGGTDSQIDLTLPAEGEYVIRANSTGRATGSYTLQLQSGGGSSYSGGGSGAAVTGGLDTRLVGSWALTIPGTYVQHSENWSSFVASAPMGVLTIDASGTYTWQKNGRTLRGRLQAFAPQRDAVAGNRYYLINDGRDEFYIFFTEYRGERYMQVNGRATDVVVAYGNRWQGR